MEKTKYVFEINANPETINQAVQNFLHKYKFKRVDHPNANLYYTKTRPKKNRCFEYYIDNNRLTIFAYMYTYQCPKGLHVNSNLIKKEYYEDLNYLYEELYKIDSKEEKKKDDSVDRLKDLFSKPYTSDQPQSLEYLINKKKKDDKTMAIYGLVLSSFSLAISFFGYMLGSLLLLLLYFILHYQVYHMKNRVIPIICLILTALSIVMTGYNFVYL